VFVGGWMEFWDLDTKGQVDRCVRCPELGVC